MIEQFAQIYGYLHGMWRYRWQALVIAWIAAMIGWAVVFALPNQYSARAVVYIDTTSIMKPLLKGLAPETDAQDELKVMSRVLLSRENLLQVIRETDMDLDIGTPAEREALVIELANSIVLKGGNTGKRWEPKSNIYEISYEDTSANRVYQVVSNILNTMIEDTLNSTRTDTVTAQKFLDNQIEEYEQRLTIAEQGLAAFKKANVGYMPDEKGSYYTRLQRAQDAVEATVYKLRLAEQRLSEMQKQLSGENPILSGSGALPGSAANINRMEQQLKELLNRFTPQHPDVLALQKIIEEEKALQETGQSDGSAQTDGSTEFNPVYQQIKVEVSKASVEVETLKIQLQQQRDQVAKLKESIDIIPEVEAKLSKLNRDYNVTRERYLDLVERRESARLAQDAGQSSSDVTFRVIEPPIVPSSASGPQRILLIFAVLVMALGAGLCWSFARYLLYPTYFEPNQISSRLGLPVLGAVSLYLSPEHRRERKIQLMTFLSATVMLFVATGVLLAFKEQGTRLVGSIITGSL